MPVRIDRLFCLVTIATITLTATVRTNAADRVAEYRAVQARPAFVAVMGAVKQAGVYEMSSQRPVLWELMQRSGGLSPGARGTVRVIRRGRVAVHTHISTGMRTELQAGDVVVIAAPQERNPNAIEVAAIGLADHPIVLRLRPENAEIRRFVELLRQPRAAESAVRVVGVSRGRAPTNVIPQHAVLLFDLRTIQRDQLPVLPRPVPLKAEDRDRRPRVTRHPPGQTQNGIPADNRQVVPAAGDGENNAHPRRLFTVPPHGAQPAGSKTQVDTASIAPPSPRDAGDPDTTAANGPFRVPVESGPAARDTEAVTSSNTDTQPAATSSRDADLAAAADAHDDTAKPSKAAFDPLTMVVGIFATIGVLSAAFMLWSMARRALVGETPVPTTVSRRTHLQNLLEDQVEIREEKLVVPMPLEFFGMSTGHARLRADGTADAAGPHFATLARSQGGVSALYERRSDQPQTTPPQPVSARTPERGADLGRGGARERDRPTWNSPGRGASRRSVRGDSMTVALDIGTHEIRSLRGDGGSGLVARRSSTAYCIAPDVATHRGLLEQLGASFAKCEDSLVVFGESAEEFSRLLRVPCDELFPDGSLHATDPLTRQIAATLVEATIGRANRPGELCALTLPPDLKSGGDKSGVQREFFTRVVRLLDYVPLELTAPQALVLAALGNDAFTGIGICFGAGSSQAGLIYRGSVLSHCAVPYGGNWIDLRMARAQQRFVWDPQGRKELDTCGARTWKETIDVDLTHAATEAEHQLADMHRGMVEFLLREAALTIGNETVRTPLPGSLPIVISGGSARIRGFFDLFCDVLATVDFPVRVTDIRMAAPERYAIARGGLIRAELEDVPEAGAAPAA